MNTAINNIAEQMVTVNEFTTFEEVTKSDFNKSNEQFNALKMETNKELINLWGVDYEVADSFLGLKSIDELKRFLPAMEPVLYKQFKDNIRKYDVIDPILYYILPDGTNLVIEGHTRLRAAIETNKKSVPTMEVKGNFESIEDIKFWMVKHQFQRRNLSNVDRLKLAYLSKDVIMKQAKKNLSKGGLGEEVTKPIDTDFEIARIAGVSKTTVSRYTRIINHGSEALIQELHRGKISIRDAADKTKSPKNKGNKSTLPSTQKISASNVETKIVDSIEAGKYLLNTTELEVLVIVKKQDDINMFTNEQKSKFCFVIQN